MIGVLPEVEVDEEETVASLKKALAEEELNVPGLVEAVQNMFKITALMTELAEEGPPFDIHPSFLQKHGGIARRIGMKQGHSSKINDFQNCFDTSRTGVNKSVSEISSFTAIGRNQNSDTKNSVLSVGFGAARLCAAKSEYQDRNAIIGTSFNSASGPSLQTGSAEEGAINVEEIVKSAMADYMECGGDDAADQFYLETSATKSITSSDNKLGSKDETKDNALDVEATVQFAVEAFMECDEVDEDFVTPFANKSEPKLGKDLVVYANEQLHDNHQKLKMNVRFKAEMRFSNALRSPFLERAVTVSCKLTPEERVMYYGLMTTYHGNEENIIYNDRIVEVMLLEFCLLLPHQEVSTGIISAYCSVLNHMEDLKSVTAPKRLFFTTYPALYTVVEANGKTDDAEKLSEFATNIGKEVSEIPHFKWGT